MCGLSPGPSGLRLQTQPFLGVCLGRMSGKLVSFQALLHRNRCGMQQQPLSFDPGYARASGYKRATDSATCTCVRSYTVHRYTCTCWRGYVVIISCACCPECGSHLAPALRCVLYQVITNNVCLFRHGIQEGSV